MSTTLACSTVPSRLTTALISMIRLSASRAPAGTFQQRSICWIRRSFSAVVSCAPSGARCGCDDGGTAAAMRVRFCGGWRSSAGAVGSRVRFFNSESKAAGSGFLSCGLSCSSFLTSWSKACASFFGSGRGFGAGFGGGGGGGGGAWATTGFGGGGGGGGFTSGFGGSGAGGGGGGLTSALGGSGAGAGASAAGGGGAGGGGSGFGSGLGGG